MRVRARFAGYKARNTYRAFQAARCGYPPRLSRRGRIDIIISWNIFYSNISWFASTNIYIQFI